MPNKMRPIKFRAWDGYKMVYDMNPDFMGHLLCGDNEFEYPLMQYTGLKDKNGKEIYEGDIVKTGEVVEFMDGNGYGRDEGTEEHLGYFLVKGARGRSLSRYDKVEVIGSIYENKELLK